MSKQFFKPSVYEDLNRPYKVTLTEGQISTILYVMEGYLQGDDKLDDEFVNDCDNIFEELEGAVDKFYQSKERNYSELVDTLVDNMEDSRNSVPVGKVSTIHHKTDLDAL